MGIVLRRRPPPAATPSVAAPVRHPQPANRARPVTPSGARSVSVTTSPGGASLGALGEPTEWTEERAVYQFLMNAFLYAAVKAKANDLRTVPFVAGTSPRKPMDFNPASELMRLLSPPDLAPGGPNPSTSAGQLLAWSSAQLDVFGRMAWELEWQGNRVARVWPLPSPRVKPIPAESGDRYWKAFRYNLGQGRTRVLSTEQVFYHWTPAPHDWRRPESPLQAARVDIDIALMQNRYDLAFLRNDAVPPAILVHEAFASKPEETAWRQQFLDEHQGPDNAGKLHFVSTDPMGARPLEAIAIHTLGVSSRDAEFIARYHEKIRAMLVAVGVPMTRLLDASDRTFANAAEEWKAYWKSTMRDRMRDLGDAINLTLAPLVGDDVGWWDTSQVEELRDDRDFSLVGLPSLVNAGLVTPNEARARLGLRPVDGGDELREPVLDEATTRITVNTGTPAAPEPATRAAVRGVRASKVGKVVAAAEKRWTRAFQRLFDEQRDAVAARIEGKRGRQMLRDVRADVDPAKVFDKAHWEKRTIEVAKDLYGDLYVLAGASMDVSASVSLDVTSELAERFIKERSNQLAGFVSDTTYAGIKEQLAEGAKNGESVPELADRIRRLFDQTYASRAETVARTEVISGYNGSTYTIALGYPEDVAAGMEWIATADERTRPTHVEADGQIVALSETFTVGGYDMAYPGDPNAGPEEVVNCRCTVRVLDPDEYQQHTGHAPPERGVVSPRPVSTSVYALTVGAAAEPSPMEYALSLVARRTG